ncbi:MAG: NAD(P)/FAD-dependent oxidoreductase [Ilumatobacteraceae bacterium]
MTGTATVVGGGPAGLMAAEVLADAGLAVTVYEHMPSVGRKLLLAGRSGLNITNNEPLDDLLARYGRAADHLANAIRNFGPPELRSWCASLGEPTFVGPTGQVFPASLRATPLLRAWLARLASAGVSIAVRHRWLGWAASPDGKLDARRSLFERTDGSTVEVTGDVTVLALGGASWPRVGSDGGWVAVLRRAGVEVSELRAANCGIKVDWSPLFAERFAGVPLKNVAVAVAGRSVRGDAMVAPSGVEGGPIYAHSAAIRDGIDRDGRCKVTFDLHPDITVEGLRDRLERRRPKDSLATSLRRTLGLTPVAVSLLREATGNRLPVDPTELAVLVKAVPLVVEATMPIERAISTAGGIAFAELDESLMLRRVPGPFVAGEMIDWEAPTGGYLLQASFSTGVTAARGALSWLARSVA